MGLLLEKKIEELENQLTPLLAPASGLPGSYPTESTGDIPAKIGFLNNLLAREMEINSENKPEYLKDVAGRLALLEAAFHNWNNHGHGAPPLDDLLINDIPTCSCTHSCLIDEQQEDEEEEEQQQQQEQLQVEDGKRLMDKEDDDDDDNDGEKKLGREVFQKGGSGNREQWRIIGVKCHRLGGVLVVVVAAAAFLAAAVNFWVVEEEDFLVPT